MNELQLCKYINDMHEWHGMNELQLCKYVNDMLMLCMIDME